VNLIGEHVDYCGYSVLPMAIQYDVVMAVKPISEPQLQLTNTDSSHSDFQCDINSFRYVSTTNNNSGVSVQKIVIQDLCVVLDILITSLIRIVFGIEVFSCPILKLTSQGSRNSGSVHQ
jgi:galactokinase